MRKRNANKAPSDRVYSQIDITQVRIEQHPHIYSPAMCHTNTKLIGKNPIGTIHQHRKVALETYTTINVLSFPWNVASFIYILVSADFWPKRIAIWSWLWWEMHFPTVMLSLRHRKSSRRSSRSFGFSRSRPTLTNVCECVSKSWRRWRASSVCWGCAVSTRRWCSPSWTSAWWVLVHTCYSHGWITSWYLCHVKMCHACLGK